MSKKKIVFVLTLIVAVVLGSMLITKIFKPKIGDEGCVTMPIETSDSSRVNETSDSKVSLDTISQNIEMSKDTKSSKEIETTKEIGTNNKKIETDSNTTESTKETSDTVELPFVPAS